MAELELDKALVDAFVADALDAPGEAVLAEQVSRVLPMHWAAPNPIAAALSQLAHKLGGERELFGWLERHPGRPRLVARLYVVISLLDRISDEPAVVTALGELRERVPYPPGLAGHLAPDTDDATLAELSARIEALLADDRTDEAFRLAVAALAMLREVAPRVGERDAELRPLADIVDQVRRELTEAHAGD
jgi:hypothetical protein